MYKNLALLLLWAGAAHALEGDPDSRFGTDGRVAVSFNLAGGSFTDNAVAIARTPTGGYLVVGTADPASAGGVRLAITRLLPTGAPDQAFGPAGKQVLISTITRFSTALVDPTGRILVVGARSNGLDLDFAVQRLLADGSADPSFGAGGTTIVGFDLGDNNEDVAQAAAIDANGDLYVVGYARKGAGNDNDYAIVKLLGANGLRDPSFNGNGKRTVAFDLSGPQDDRARSVLVTAVGQVLVAGSAVRPGFGRDLGFVLLGANGVLDTNFCATALACPDSLLTSGRRTLGFDLGGNFNDDIFALVEESNGTLIAAGRAAAIIGPNPATVAVLARIASDGALTAGWGNGSGITSFSATGLTTEAYAAAIEATSGKLLIAGISGQPLPGDQNRSLLIARFLTDGSPDSGYASDGLGSRNFVEFDFPRSPMAPRDFALANAVIIDRTRAVAAGSSLFDQQPGLVDLDFAVARTAGDLIFDSGVDY